MNDRIRSGLAGAVLAGVIVLRLAGVMAQEVPQALFTEDFGREAALIGRSRQSQTYLPVKHAHELPGWQKRGADLPAHFVEQYPGNWALMLVANRPDQNVFTLAEGVLANETGQVYTVSFDAGPGVYAAESQATAEHDQLAVELLRPDDSVLTRHVVTSGKWLGKTAFQNHLFHYEGDGSGGLRFRIAPVYTEGFRFFGAIDHLQVFASAAAARRAVAARQAEEARAREAAAGAMAVVDRGYLPVQVRNPATPPTAALSAEAADAALRRDWLFQAGDDSRSQRALLEIGWARAIAQRLARQSAPPDLSAELAELETLERQWSSASDTWDSPRAHEEFYLAVRRIKRRIVLSNPAVGFSQLVFIDQPYPAGPEWQHQSGHRMGHRAVAGGRLLVLEGLHPGGDVRKLAPDKPGSFWRPDVAFDADKVLFCYKAHDEQSFGLYEIGLDGTAPRRLTQSDYDDIDPIYLPDGHIMFTTTRGNTYVRCGPYMYAYVLARCDADGRNVYLISTNSEPDFVPALLPDGRVVYSRWEYSDKEQDRTQSLWTTNQDGTGTAVLWGNQSRWPDHPAEPRPVPGSRRIMFTGVGHHDWFRGSIGLVDPQRGTDFPHGLTRVTGHLAWAEVSNPPAGDALESPQFHAAGAYTGYLSPYPLSDEDYLVSARGEDDKFRIYLADVHGNSELIYEGVYNAWYPIPVTPRRAPLAQPDRVAWPGTGTDRQTPQPGVFFNADVYWGVPELPPGSVKYLQVIQQDATTFSTWMKTWAFGPPVSAVQTEAVKRIVTIVPVEPDGSVHFVAPAGQSLYFQLLDKDFRALHTMRSFTGVLPGEQRGCVGCHKLHSAAPPAQPATALLRPPTDISPPPWGAESIGYERFVQPVLDHYCGPCHQGRGDARAALDLTPRPASHPFTEHFTEPYLTLIGPAAWPHSVPAEDKAGYGLAGAIPVYALQPDDVYSADPATDAYSTIQRTLRPMRYLSYRSRLIELARSGQHHGVVVAPHDLRRLMAWVDANCPYRGDEELRAMDDPEFPGIEQLPIRPRMRTAPVVDRP